MNRIELQKGIATRTLQMRDARGWTQKELAKRAGIKRDTLASLETRTCMPSLMTVIGLARVFGITIDYLVFGGGVDVD
ncbi:MAG: helix-turn-helix transcriptional regulator [Lachnospiraceae bacterium]|nr:helix-turn-helix transcriptional regulator [Lachnospiraceae bacterium]